MSGRKLVLISLAGVLMLAQSLYAQTLAGTYSIAFISSEGIPYCDGATLTFSAGSSFVSGTHNNYDCQGDSTWLDGVNSTLTALYPKEGVEPVALSDNVGVLKYGNSALTLYLNIKNQTWSYYLESGGVLPETRINQGTFKFVADVVLTESATNLASWQNPGTVVADPNYVLSGYPAGTYELTLYDADNEEYCDFFRVTADGRRVGGYHDLATVCRLGSNAPTGGDYALLANDVVVGGGPDSSSGGVAGHSLLLTDNEGVIDFEEDYTLNYYFNFDKSMWSLYATDGTTGLQLFNWGYFVVVPYNPLKPGTVTLPVGGSPSATPHSH